MKKKWDFQTVLIVILTLINILLIIFKILCPNAAAAEWETWYVGCDGLNLRTEATTDSDIITVYPHGTELSVIGTDGGSWWEVYDGERQGWVHKDYMVDAPDKYALGEYIGVFYITGYTPNPAENDGYTTTYLGDDLRSNVGNIVAVDPSVIPLNRTLYIEGIGYRRTRDTGVRGRVIDVLTGSDAESYAITANRKVWLVE